MQTMTSTYAPAWFRYGVIAMATMMLCSCQATQPTSPSASRNQNGPMGQFSPSVALTSGETFIDDYSLAATRSGQGDRTRGTETIVYSDSNNIGQSVMPVVYQEDRHVPPPAVRQAEYAAGIRPASCGCGNHGCGPAGCGNRCAIVGPRDEYLCDGGDGGLAVGIRKDWQVDGLEQEDTVAHYDTVDGRTVVTPSNQVCIYAPRFGVVRKMIDLHEYARADMAGGIESPLSLSKIDENERATTSLAQLEPTIHRVEDPATLMRERQQLGELDRALVVEEAAGLLSPYADLQLMRTGTLAGDEKALLARASLAAVAWEGDQAPQITIDKRHAQAAVRDAQPGIVYHLHDPKKPHLRLVKLASCGSAKPGDEVEFTLRFDNVGSQVIGNVTLMDNLTTRLEYVADSARSSVEADFTAEPNTGGSVVLRWEIKEPIEAGKGGVLQFKCKVR